MRTALVGTLNERLFRHRDEIHRIVTEHHATAPRVFGSVARGDASSSSDVDVLVDFTPEAGLLDEIGLRLALTDLLHVDVDVVASDSLRGEFRERVLREAIPI
ncbi:nucleotidyltransferase [Microbacterium sp. HMWF026]|nr:nucleotidyltransferase [Microbacterium sp. HMWF026]